MNQIGTPASVSALTCQIIHSFEEFSALESEWNALLLCSAQNSIFLRHEWLSSWWSVFATERHTLSILVIRTGSDEGEQLVGVAPFQFIRSLSFVDPKLCFVGAGEPKNSEVVSEYLDIFARPDVEKDVVSLVTEWIMQNREWSSFECKDHLEDALISKVVSELLTVYPGKATSNHWAYRLPLNPDNELLDHVTPSRRKRLERTIRAIDREGGLTRKEADSASTLADHFSVLKKLHHERWASEGKTSSFDDHRFVKFHELALKKLHPQGLANIILYSLNNEDVSALYLYFTDTTAYYYQSGFVTQNANRYMPLTNAHRLEIDHQATLHRTQYDFMRGEDNSYKSEFGCEKVPLLYCRVHRRASHFMAVNSKNYLRQTASWIRRSLK